ncbi:hypothetical protein YP72344_41390 [Yersinia pseudotuberculosis]|nr:hypothetical protein YP72344_41390 [Yersinia pseudotuberculosis]BET60567.1 hypothetical protein YPSE1_00260 [Yersinia pseudotuberculosis]
MEQSFVLFFSIGYRISECIFKNEHTLVDFVGNITMDMAKIAVASATSFLLGSVLTAVGFLGGSVIAVAFAVFVLGVAITIGLDFLDKKYGISVKIIALLKKAMEIHPRTPEANLQYILNGLGGNNEQ